MLKDNGFEVLQSYQHGKLAISEIKLLQPNIVILDFQLKDITGLEVAKKIKCSSPLIKIFMLTAHTESSVIERIFNDKNIDGIGLGLSHVKLIISKLSGTISVQSAPGRGTTFTIKLPI